MDNENRFLRCAMDYKLSVIQRPATDLDNRFVRCAIEHRAEQNNLMRYKQYGYSQRLPKQYHESINVKAERLRKEKSKSYDQEFPVLTPPTSLQSSLQSSPHLAPLVKEPPPGLPIPMKWVDKVRINEKSSLPVQKTTPSSSGQKKQQSVATKEEDIVFDADGFPYMRMIDYLYE
jgi:hypothetical protein